MLYNALLATLNPGDEVIIPSPYWVSYPDIVLLAGAEPVIVETKLEDGFKLTPQALARRDHGQDEVVHLQFAVKPDRRRLYAEEIKALTDVLVKHEQVWVLSDDIYEHLVYDGLRFTTPAAVEPKLKARTLTHERRFQGLFHDRLAYRLWRRAGAVDQSDRDPPVAVHLESLLDQPMGGGRGTEGSTGFLKDWVASFQERRDLVVSMLNQAKGLSCPKPEGAFYVYPSCAGVIGKTRPTASGSRMTRTSPRAARGGGRRRGAWRGVRALALLPHLLCDRDRGAGRGLPPHPALLRNLS